jgi:hypothetical protein
VALYNASERGGSTERRRARGVSLYVKGYKCTLCNTEEELANNPSPTFESSLSFYIVTLPTSRSSVHIMKLVLAWLLLAQIVSSKPHADRSNIEPMQPQEGRDLSAGLAPETPNHDATSSAPKDVPKQAPEVKKRDELPPGTKSYSVWVTDRDNEKQINETHEWLKDIVKYKSKLHMWKSFPWETDEEVPEDEMQKFFDEGRFDDVDKYQKVGGWMGAVLDAAGYDAVVKKTEWIRDVTPTYKPVAMIPVHGSRSETAHILAPRKVEWGDWDKEKDVLRDLVQASNFE